MPLRLLTAAAALVVAACGQPDRPPPAPPNAQAPNASAPNAQAPNAQAPNASAAPARPGGVVDSLLPMDELLRRFRADLGPAPRGLAGGEASRDALVRRFVRAVESRDTAAVRALVLTRAEFAWLYFPSHPLARRPYEMPPALLWFQISEGSGTGITRLFRRLGGRPLGYVSHACGAEQRQGGNRVWERCTVRRVRAPGDTTEGRLFGSVVERGGRYKFVGYANDL